MCSSVRVAAAALAGYLVGGLTGSSIVSWLAMVAAGLAMLLWSQASSRRNGCTSCALPRATGRRASAGAAQPAQPAQPSRS